MLGIHMLMSSAFATAAVLSLAVALLIAAWLLPLADWRVLRVVRQLFSPKLSFSNPESIYAELSNGQELAPVLLLRYSWLKQRAERIRACTSPEAREQLALPRRQDLLVAEPDAFFTAAEVRGMERNTELCANQLPVLAVSYTWETPDHPDPLGETLVLLADAIERAQLFRDQQQSLPDELAIFWDWASLCQKGPGGAERPPPEQAAFDSALRRMQLWYAHQQTTVVMITVQRAGSEALPYHSRGWPTFERGCSMLAKPGGHCRFWPSLIVVSPSDTSTCKRLAPPTPERMRAELATKTFTNHADHEVVLTLYRETALAVIGGAKTLDFGGLGWDDAQLAAFCEWLPQCRALEGLALSENRITDAGLATLAVAVTHSGVLPRLKFLDLAENRITDAGLTALAEAVTAPSVLPKLETLGLHKNRITEAGPTPLAQAMERGALPAMKHIYLGDGAGNDDMQRVKGLREPTPRGRLRVGLFSGLDLLALVLSHTLGLRRRESWRVPYGLLESGLEVHSGDNEVLCV
jgi:hypothetical protein